MELLEKYLYQVGRHLLKKDKEDTLNELKSLILDQLDEKLEQGVSEDEALTEIITTIGEPRMVAYRYRNINPLISRELEMIMYTIIKSIAIAIPIGIMVAKTVEFVTQETNFTAMDLFLNWAYSIPSVLTAVITSIGVVFFIFLMIERYADTSKLEQFVYDPKTLPPLPKKVFRVSIFEIVFMVLGSVAFLYILNFNQGLISIADGSGIKRPLLNENFENILPFINLNIFLGLGYSLINLGKRRKTKATKTLEFFHNVFNAIILFYFASNNVFDSVLVEDHNLQFLKNGFRVVMYVLSVVSLIGAITEYIKMFMDRD
jgi:ABC-type proline/glycine betaine transport system permease subunit